MNFSVLYTVADRSASFYLFLSLTDLALSLFFGIVVAVRCCCCCLFLDFMLMFFVFTLTAVSANLLTAVSANLLSAKSFPFQEPWQPEAGQIKAEWDIGL